MSLSLKGLWERCQIIVGLFHNWGENGNVLMPEGHAVGLNMDKATVSSAISCFSFVIINIDFLFVIKRQ